MARQKAEDWRARLARFEASGLTVAEFSLRERVDARQLRWWKWRLAQEAVSSTARAVGAIPSFAPVVIEAATVTSSEVRRSRRISCLMFVDTFRYESRARPF